MVQPGKRSEPYRIDTHHHILPPAYVAEERERILADAQIIPIEFLEWTPGKAVEEMDRNGVATAITSISTPGVWFGNPEQSRRLARLCNEYGAEMSRDHPGRFGMFAALPVPDIDASLREIDYALDVLKLDGIGLMTNYGDRWPGDPSLAPLFEELNRRKSVVYFHPTSPTCCPDVFGVSAPTVEFPADTARAIASLLLNGTFSRCADLRFIFSHAGGAMPMLVGRIVGALGLPAMKHVAELVPKGGMYELQRLYYDTASAANPPAMAALSKIVPMTQVLFGSDFPYWPIAKVREGLRDLGLSDADRMAIERNNALRLFPRYGRT